MCGILGLIRFDHAIEQSSCRQLELGLEQMKGRGPDGFWLFADRHVLLSQSLLLISEPDGPITPYASNGSGIVACVNGELYNSGHLRTQLQNDGAIFSTESDCEVVAHGYAMWGEELFEQLDGMFAIALYDREAEALTLARDKVGIRPLYYTVREGYCAFASEPRMLTVSDLASSDICDEGLFHSLVLRRPLEPTTMYKDVRAVRPGEVLGFSRPHRTQRFFAAVPSVAEIASQQGSVTRGGTALNQSLRRAVARRVPERGLYSLFLSGGLDSTIINCLAPRDCGRRLPSLVAGFEDSSGLDERVAAKNAADAIGTKLEARTVDSNGFLGLWPLLVWINSEPLMFNSSVPMYLLCREAKRWGAKVMLSGEGADELFAGYAQYPAYKEIEDDGHPSYLLRHDDEIVPPQFVLDAWVADKSWGNSQWERLQSRLDSEFPFRGSEHGLARKMDFDQASFMRGLLMRQDRVGLNSSIEIRVPFLDTEVIDHASGLPVRSHIENGVGKQFLRKAFESDLTPDLAYTPKVGFPVPIGDWLANPTFRTLCDGLNSVLNDLGVVEKDAIRSLSSGQSKHQSTNRKLWTLLNLSLWWRTRDASSLSDDVWLDLLPSGLYQPAVREFDDTQHSFEPGHIFNMLADQSLPVVIEAVKWDKASVRQI